MPVAGFSNQVEIAFEEFNSNYTSFFTTTSIMATLVIWVIIFRLALTFQGPLYVRSEPKPSANFPANTELRSYRALVH